MSWHWRPPSIEGRETFNDFSDFDARFSRLTVLGSEVQSPPLSLHLESSHPPTDLFHSTEIFPLQISSLLNAAPMNVAPGIDAHLGSATATSWPAVFELSSLDGTNGFQVNGEAANDFSGGSVSSAGDVNGDGLADLIIGAQDASPYSFRSGASYVVFGQAGGFGANVDLSSLDGSNGFRLTGEAANSYSGCSVASAGDINGDGFGDVIVGAFFADGHAGASYVVFGRASGFVTSLGVSGLDGTNGFKISGEPAPDGRSGFSVGAAGDVNGDGLDDVIVGAFILGKSYVVFGRESGFAADFELSDIDGSNGFKISGYNWAGFSVASAGDVNGDGLSDLIVGNPHDFGQNSEENAGAAYVVFGNQSGFAAELNLSSLDGANGFKLSGWGLNSNIARSVASAGDINGDGFDDLIVGAPDGSYVVFGKATGFTANLNLSTLDGASGFRIAGEAAGYDTGISVASAGDFNGDGYDDLIVGAWQANPNGTHSGASYVVFGKASGFEANLNLSTLDGANGLKINGEAAYDFSGYSVSSAGDVNGDGFDDLIVGAMEADGFAGASYVIFGHATLPIIPPHPPSADAVAEMAFLSKAAYEQSGHDLISNLAGSQWIPVTPVQLGVASSDAEFYERELSIGSIFGFAAAFVAIKDNTLAISFRGSQGDGPLGADILNDYLFAAANQQAYYSEYADLIQAVLSYIPTYNASNPTDISKVCVTGHSLGGAMAEWFAASDAARFGQLGLDISIATFGSPGIPSYVSSNSYLANVLEFGNAEDAVFNHLGLLRVLDATGLQHRGIPISVTIPNVSDPHPSINFREHNSALYEHAMRALDASALGQEYLDSGHVRTLIVDALINGSGEAPLDFHTSSKALFILGDSGVAGFADSDVIYGGSASDWIDGGIGNDQILGGDGADRIVGASGNDVLDGSNGSDDLAGGDGRDRLVGGAGKDTIDGGANTDSFVYGAASDSTGQAYDTVKNADFTADKFDISGIISGVDAVVNHGSLSTGNHFDSKLTSVLNGHLGAQHAILFTPDAGNLAGTTFLVVDLNGVAGYQVNGDLVIELDGAVNLANLSVGNFI